MLTWIRQHTGVKFHPFARTFPMLARRLLGMPQWLLPKSTQETQNFMAIVDRLARVAYDEAISEGKSSSEHKTVLHSIFQSDTLPEEEKAYARVRADAFIFIGAGTETTGRTLAVTIYHILSKRSVYNRLVEELRTVMPTSVSPVPSTTTLDGLPYLTAVIQEGTRIAHGVAGRLARTAPDEDLQYGKYLIPRGSTLSQSHYLLHTDPQHFPDPFAFAPERFLGPEGDSARRHLFSFGKGNRSCVGMNLAYSEMYLTIAVLIGSVKMELFETADRDAETVTEYFIGLLPDDSKGIRVKVLGLL